MSDGEASREHSCSMALPVPTIAACKRTHLAKGTFTQSFPDLVLSHTLDLHSKQTALMIRRNRLNAILAKANADKRKQTAYK